MGKSVFNGRPAYEYKNGDQSIQTTEPEVIEQVIAEVKALGDNTKALVDGIQKDHADLKKAIDAANGRMDAITEEKVRKMAEALNIKQAELEAHSKKRADELEASIQRIGKRSVDSLEDAATAKSLLNEAREMKIALASVKGHSPDALSFREVTDDDINRIRGYKKAFPVYLRYGLEQVANLHPEEYKLLMVAKDPDGGILVTPEMSGMIVELIRESGEIRRLAGTETIGTDSLEILEDLDQPEDGWETETTAISETDTPRWNKITIPVHYQSARPRATQKFLDDASINAEQWLARKVASKLSRTEEAAFVTGTGVGRPMGFLSYSAWTDDETFEFNKVAQINMGAAATITADGLRKIYMKLFAEYRNRATWVMNRLTVLEIMLLKDGLGQYIWKPGIEVGGPSNIMGRPVSENTTMPTVTTNALSVAFADWQRAYKIVDRQGITTQRDPYTAKPLVEFYTRKRVGGAVADFAAIKIGKIAA